MNATIFEVTIRRASATGELWVATGESDGHQFRFTGDLDTIYHEVENQLDSATTREEVNHDGEAEQKEGVSPRSTR